MKFLKILVPVKGLAIDDQAVSLACQTARQSKARVVLTHVIEMHRALPLETESAPDIERGESILGHADRLARDLGVQPETELLQARVVGPVLLDEATKQGVDLIVLGVPYRPPLDEFPLGSTVRHLLKNARCSVWLCREPAETSRVDRE